MSYLVIARKYRPQIFEEVVGQQHISTTLKNSILTQRVAHAYLFAGSRGVGKTSMARIFAKALNCPKAKKGEPCNQCEVCTSIAQGVHMDVLEIDGASHRGVEDVAILRDGSKYMPTQSPYKIYIIDEVHMLTRHAFNALLKTLEEPPSHVKFIFATTEPNKVPDTILSRCQRFDFKRISPADMVVRLKQIAEKEGVEVEEKAFYQIAQAARGGMRDSQSLLDQALSFCGKKITAQDLASFVGILPREKILDFLATIIEKNVPAGLAFLDEIYWAGVDLREFLTQCSEEVRNLMVAGLLGKSARDLSGMVLDEAWHKLADQTNPDELLLFLQVLSSTREKLRVDTQPRILAEMALIYLCRLDKFAPLSQIRTTANPASNPSAPAPLPPPVRQPLPTFESGPPVRKSPLPPREPDRKPPTQFPAPQQEPEKLPQNLKGNIKANWMAILKALGKKDRLFSTSLSMGKLVKESDNTLEIAFSPSDDFHREMMADRKHDLEVLLKEVTGEKYKINICKLEFVRTPKDEPSKLPIQLDPVILKAVKVFSGSLIIPETNKQKES